MIERRWKPPAAPEPDEVEFSEYAAQSLDSRDLSPRTRAEYRKVLDDPRLADFTGYTPNKISPTMIKRWWSAHEDGHHRPPQGL